MAIKTIDVKNTIGIEQGTITTTGTDSDPTRIHSVGFIALEYVGSPPSSLVISVSTSTGKTLNVSYVVYNTADYTDISYDPNAWLTNPYTADLSGKSNVHYIATYARNSNNSNISPSDITAWTITYDDGTVYHAYEGEYPVNDSAMPIVQTDFTPPFPLNRWRIDQSNDGYPYTDLQLGILTYEPPHPPPPPPGPTGVPTVQPIATTEITDQTSIQWKRYTVGYTNPDLFRFRDGDLPGNTKCDVFIKGTNSYRYTEERDHIDGSQTTETP